MAKHEDLAHAVADSKGNGCLAFEKPLAELESQIAELQVLQQTKGIDYSPEIRQLRGNLVQLTAKVYKHLTPWESVQVARHPRRPLVRDYIGIIIKDFCELHGDRCFGDDPAMVTGLGRLGREKVIIVGHDKGRDTRDKITCNFGSAHPEGYRKAMRAMKLAEKFQLPVVTLIDTPGAYPGIGAEERGQAQSIAVSMMEMARLKTPTVCVIIGEGGSGGALGIGFGDRVAMLQYAYYSVISPEGCAAILYKDGGEAARAADHLKLTAPDLLQHNLIDDIIEEPLGGAHRNWHQAAHNIEQYLLKRIRDLGRCKLENLLNNRYKRIRAIGEFRTGVSLPVPKKAVPEKPPRIKALPPASASPAAPSRAEANR
ncbi:MAG: acetyl-CoA carboxylase carboxyltransferase subunit alpha [Sedimentisphaerales bacterium]|nr:acetyl-CoA carboxylase carboxyltransferase subunit alpha [Sedimentisphaerales bacterium]